MKYINKYLRNFIPYKLASHRIWMADAEERARILKLDWNEATIPPSPKVGERLKKLIDDGSFYNLYPSTYNEELLELLSEYVGLQKENIQYFASSDSLHEYIAKLYITVGDPVLLLGPTYDNFRLTAEVCGAEIYFFNIDETFEFNGEEFISRIEDVEPSLVYICNPNNPTGTLHSIEFIEVLLNRFPQVLFLIDEAYAEFSGISAKELVLRYENLLISRTMSKAFALANFRFGYLIASKDNIEYISNIRNPKNITTFAQEAAAGVLSDIPYMRAYVGEVCLAAKQFAEEMSELSDYLRCISGVGNFALLCLNDMQDKPQLIEHLLARDIYVRDLSQTEYFRSNCFRVTIGTREQMERVTCAIKSYFKGEQP